MLLQESIAGLLPPAGRAARMLRQPWLLLLLLLLDAACWHTAAKGSNTARCMTDSTIPPACKGSRVSFAPPRQGFDDARSCRVTLLRLAAADCHSGRTPVS
jgi:hypothetical protein